MTFQQVPIQCANIHVYSKKISHIIHILSRLEYTRMAVYTRIQLSSAASSLSLPISPAERSLKQVLPPFSFLNTQQLQLLRLLCVFLLFNKFSCTRILLFSREKTHTQLKFILASGYLRNIKKLPKEFFKSSVATLPRSLFLLHLLLHEIEIS